MDAPAIQRDLAREGLGEIERSLARPTVQHSGAAPMGCFLRGLSATPENPFHNGQLGAVGLWPSGERVKFLGRLRSIAPPMESTSACGSANWKMLTR